MNGCRVWSLLNSRSNYLIAHANRCSVRSRILVMTRIEDSLGSEITHRQINNETEKIAITNDSLSQPHDGSSKIQSLDASQCSENRKKVKPRMSRSMKASRKQQQRDIILPESDQRPIDENQILKNDAIKNVATSQSITDKLIKSAKDAFKTGAVSIHKRLSDTSNCTVHTMEQNGDIINSLNAGQYQYTQGFSQSIDNECHNKIQVVTNCLDLPFQEMYNASSATIMVKVKPLLILDLNGIVCHRIRPSKELPETNPYKPEKFFRAIVANVANTKVVARPDLNTLLEYLSTNFCLAIWTSAKAKTANTLLNALFPENIVKSLLFVWAQHDCQRIMANGTRIGNDRAFSDSDIFVKDIQQVWNKYPLWNTNNTLLVDDSPEKCVAWRENAVHPPPMNGLKDEIKLISKFSNTMLDSDNVTHQRLFFERFVDHWSQNDLVQDWDSECDDSIVMHRIKNQVDFLSEHAVGHMGWSNSHLRISSK